MHVILLQLLPQMMAFQVTVYCDPLFSLMQTAAGPCRWKGTSQGVTTYGTI